MLPRVDSWFLTKTITRFSGIITDGGDVGSTTLEIGATYTFAGIKEAIDADGDCLFAWAESNYPQFFAGASASTDGTGELTGWRYRLYGGATAALAVTSDALYYIGPVTGNALVKIEGTRDTWLATARCR